MMRKNSLFILLLVALLSFPAFAFADSSTDELSGGKGVGWQGIITSGDDAGLYGAAGRARNKYNMACWVMGKNPLTIPDEVRSRLSDPSYGGRFYEYANTFESIPSWEYVPEWQPTYANLTYVLYGFDFQWESAVPQSLYEGAKEDFRRILSGEDLGGGGSGGNVSGYTPFELVSGRTTFTYSVPSDQQHLYRCNYYNAVVDSDGNVTLTGGQGTFSDVVGIPTYVSSVRLYVSPSVRSYLQSLGKEYCFIVGVNGGDETVRAGFVYGDDLVISRHAHPSSSSVIRDFVEGSNLRQWVSSPISAYHDSSGVFIVMPDVVPSDIQTVSYSGPGFYSSFVTAPAAPDGDWPEPVPTPTPTPPEIPTPTAPTVTPDPTPTEPTPTWPVIPTPTAPTVVTVVTPEGLDYTQLLTLINDNLNDINSYTVAINSSLNSLRSDLVTEFEGVTQGLRNIYQYLQHLDDLLERHCKHIRDSIDENIYELELYLKGLFEWLPQQLNFDAEFTYDDSSVVNWLKQIYAKLGGGTSAPNPVADPGGFFEWLGGLIAGFIAGIVAGLPGKLQELVSDITDLTEFFPFSAPWDIYAMLLLFAHDPVTPVFSIPWGLGSGNVVNVVVDCTQWDGVMTIVRSVEKIIFAGGLAKLTFNMFKPTDVMGD